MFIAHAAHWVTTLGYVSPVVAIAVWLIVTQQRERLQARRRGESLTAGGRSADCTSAQADSARSALP